MKLTTKTRYAVRAMVELASQPLNKTTPLGKIAHDQGIKRKYLEQIFLKLHNAGLISSVRGPRGGYIIKKNPKSIKLSAIMAAVGESSVPVFCVDQKNNQKCPRNNRCPTQMYWRKLKKVIDGFLNAYTLSDALRRRDCF